MGKGDLNKDNKIDLVDVNYLLRYIARDPNYPIENLENGDVNLDGEIGRQVNNKTYATIKNFLFVLMN